MHAPTPLTGFTLVLACALAGCAGFGPSTIDRDSLDYGEAWGTGTQRQLLLNIIKLRYGEAPMFLEVASVINQYALEGQVGFNTPPWDRPTTFGPPVATASGRWLDRPTITYTPVIGERFTRSLLTPIPPASMASMLQSGWPAEFVFGVTVRSINGVRNGTRGALLREEPDPRFGEILQGLTVVQQSSQLGLRVVRREERDAVLVIIEQGVTGEVQDARHRIRELLGLSPDSREFQLVFGMLPGDDEEIAILSRSVLEVLGEFSFGVEVPLRHVMEGRTSPNPEFDGPWAPPRIWIHSGEELPEDTFIAVPYRNLWFWIDDRDFASKRLFTFAMLLITLAESGTRRGGPVVTVGAG